MLSIFELTSILLVLCAFFGFVNRAFLDLPSSVGLLLLGMIASMLLVAVELLFPEAQLYTDIGTALRQINFSQVVFNGMLAFLLFCGRAASRLRRAA
jgi:CPA1 family monovalent cation:H+ antiporter